MRKIINLIPLLIVGMLGQMGLAHAETQGEKEALQQLEQLQTAMAKRTQLAQADPRLDIFKAIQTQRAGGGNAPAAGTSSPASPPPLAPVAAAVPGAPTTPATSAPATEVQTPAAPSLAGEMPAETANAIEESAFRQVLRAVTPMSPDKISQLKKAFLEERLAVQSPVGTPPKPVATTQFINLSPGATPPVVRLAKGFVSSLVFIDSTGAPWNIESYDIGDPGSFNIQWDKKSNTLMVQANKLYTYGNMAVKLWDLNTPIMLTLVPGQKAVDYRVDLRVPSVGPMAKAPVSTSVTASSANDDLLSVLNGVPPADVHEVIVSGGQAQAWVRGTTMFVRTEAQMLSPGWISSMRSADGMNAYELPVSPRLLMSVRGKIIQYKVEGL